MAPTVLVVADGLAHDGLASRLGPAATRFAASFLADTVAVACSLRNTRVAICSSPDFPPEALAAVSPDVRVAPIEDVGGPALAAVLADALANGDPALLIGADLPHLPPWRLRDALTYL